MTLQLGRMPYLRYKATDSNGKPLANGYVLTFLAGSSQSVNTYKDWNGSVWGGGRVELNNDGEAEILLDATKAYKFLTYDSNDNLKATDDNITISGGGGSFVDTYMVKTNADDTSAGFLESKIQGTDGIAITLFVDELNGNHLEVKSLGKIKLNENSDSKYIGEILQAGNNIAITESNGQLVISSTLADSFKVKVDANGTEGYLESKIVASNGIAINKVNDALVISSTVESIGVVDTNSVNLTKTMSSISADVNVSQDSNNAVEIRNDGLFVEQVTPFIESVSDTYYTDLDVTNGVLTSNPKFKKTFLTPSGSVDSANNVVWFAYAPFMNNSTDPEYTQNLKVHSSINSGGGAFNQSSELFGEFSMSMVFGNGFELEYFNEKLRQDVQWSGYELVIGNDNSGNILLGYTNGHYEGIGDVAIAQIDRVNLESNTPIKFIQIELGQTHNANGKTKLPNKKLWKGESKTSSTWVDTSYDNTNTEVINYKGQREFTAVKDSIGGFNDRYYFFQSKGTGLVQNLICSVSYGFNPPFVFALSVHNNNGGDFRVLHDNGMTLYPALAFFDNVATNLKFAVGVDIKDTISNVSDFKMNVFSVGSNNVFDNMADYVHETSQNLYQNVELPNTDLQIRTETQFQNGLGVNGMALPTFTNNVVTVDYIDYQYSEVTPHSGNPKNILRQKVFSNLSLTIPSGSFTASQPYVQVYIDSSIPFGSSPTLKFQTGYFGEEDYYTKIPLFVVSSIDLTNISGYTLNTMIAKPANRMIRDLLKVIGNPKLGFNLSGMADLSFAISNGKYYAPGANANGISYYNLNTDVLPVNGINSPKYYRATRSSLNFTQQTLLDVTQYDANGTLTAIPTNNWVAHRIYMVQDGGTPLNTNKMIYIVQYGQATYATKSDALSGFVLENFVENNVCTAMTLAGVVIVKKNATATNGVDAQFITSDKLGQLGTGSGGGGTTAYIQSVANTSTINLTVDVNGSLTANVNDGSITSAKILDGTIANSDLANMVAYSVKGNSGTTTGVPTDITSASASRVLARPSTGGLAFVQVTSAMIATDTITASNIAANAITSSELADGAVDTTAILDNNVTNAKLALMPTMTVKGNVSGVSGISDVNIKGASSLASALISTDSPNSLTTGVDGGLKVTVPSSASKIAVVTNVTEFNTAMEDNNITHIFIEADSLSLNMTGQTNSIGNVKEIYCWGSSELYVQNGTWTINTDNTNHYVYFFGNVSINGNTANAQITSANNLFFQKITTGASSTFTTGVNGTGTHKYERLVNNGGATAWTNNGTISQSYWNNTFTSPVGNGFFTSLTGEFLSQTIEFGYTVPQRLYTYKKKIAVPFTINKVRVASSVSGGSLMVLLYRINTSTGACTKVATATISFSSAGFVESTFDNSVNVVAGETIQVCSFVTNSQVGSNNYIAGTNASAPQLSTNFASADRPLAYLSVDSDTPPSSFNMTSTTVPASASIPFLELIQ